MRHVVGDHDVGVDDSETLGDTNLGDNKVWRKRVVLSWCAIMRYFAHAGISDICEDLERLRCRLELLLEVLE